MALLDVQRISKRFGGLLSLDGVSFQVEAGSIVGLIGPNGAGKTTCFNIITGFLAPTSGSVHFDGVDITGLPPEAVAARGVCRTFPPTSVFGGLSVLENVLYAQYLRRGTSHLAELLGLPTVRAEAQRRRAEARQTLERVGIAHRARMVASSLAYGEQRRLEVAIALATRPRLLLMDEPAAGMNPTEAENLIRLMLALKAEGMTIVLVEHHMRVVMGVCDRVVVLSFGRKIAEGDPERVAADPQVIEVYLGEKAGR